MPEDNKVDVVEPKASTSRDSQSGHIDSESGSRSSSSGSSMDTKEPAETKKNTTGPHLGTKKIVRTNKKKRRVTGRVAGRVDKRKTSRRVKRKPKAKGPRAWVPSTSSIYTLGRSETSTEKICKYCGHRCCLRRYEYEKRQYRKAKRRRNDAGQPANRITSVSAEAQAGSRADMLSPLYIKSNSTDGQRPTPPKHCQVTPEMIYETLRRLTKLRQGVAMTTIFKYIRANYPVNPNAEELMADLIEKLHVASIAGLIWALPNDCWRLTTAIERVNRLEQSHVTIFWKVYADTLKPLNRKRKRVDSETETNKSSQQTETERKDLV